MKQCATWAIELSGHIHSMSVIYSFGQQLPLVAVISLILVSSSSCKPKLLVLHVSLTVLRLQALPGLHCQSMMLELPWAACALSKTASTGRGTFPSVLCSRLTTGSVPENWTLVDLQASQAL